MKLPIKIESIEKDMVGFNNQIRPYYQPRLYIEDVDGKTIIVIKVLPGERRPYKVPDKITAKQKTYNYYIRYNSSTIIPKDEYERELINLAKRMPFDDRGNDEIKLTDISPLLLHDYLIKVKSSLADVTLSDRIEDVLVQMDLLEPIEITIEPDRISILSFSGPNHTIPIEAVRTGKSLRSRRYRNRRLGEFLKELDLTEGRATGIPTIQDELRDNGSPQATIETDDERSYFLIDIPCHPDFINDRVVLNTDVTKDVTKELSEKQKIILKMIEDDALVTVNDMSQKTDVAVRTIKRDLEYLKKQGILARVGGRKEGHWVIRERSIFS